MLIVYSDTLMNVFISCDFLKGGSGQFYVNLTQTTFFKEEEILPVEEISPYDQTLGNLVKHFLN